MKEQYEKELKQYNSTLDGYNSTVSALQKSCNENKTGQALQMKKFKAELVSLQSERICKLLLNLGEEFRELRDDILVDMKKEGLIE